MCLPLYDKDAIQEIFYKHSLLPILLLPKPLCIAIQVETSADEWTKLLPLDHPPPEIPEHHYTFAGEVPWCETFPYYRNAELSFIVGVEKKRVPIEETEFLKNGRNLSGDELKELFEVVDKYRNKKISKEDVNRYFEENKLQIRKIRRFKTETSQKTNKYKVIIPISTLNLGAHETIVNPGLSAYVLSKELCQIFDLSSRPQTYDLYDMYGKRASITLKWGNDLHTFHKLIYIRRDLLDRVLQDKGLDLIWGIWGERRYRDKEDFRLREFAKKQLSYKVFQRIETYRDIIDRRNAA